MLVNLDLHIHSRYSMAVSEDMLLPQIAGEAERKGVRVMGTGDCLHPRWREAIARLPESGGLFSSGRTLFLLSVEVEDCRRAHHLIFLPDLTAAEELAASFSPHCSDLAGDGRPRLHLTGPEIADRVIEAGGALGPAHAFTPWTGMYAVYASLADCYQEHAAKIGFLELGLSADTDYADRIAELSSLTFLSNSDAHSPRPSKLAREFNQMQLQDLTYREIVMALSRQGGRRVTLNAGFFPEEGKYNRTACTRCYQQYSAPRMAELMGRCPSCGGRIKLGVADRISALADHELPVHPDHRPPYKHIIPLAEIIALAIGKKSVMTAGVQRCYRELTETKTEIDVLLEADLDDLRAEERIKQAIADFRSGRVAVQSGGGGRYGTIGLPGSADRHEELHGKCPANGVQRSLCDF